MSKIKKVDEEMERETWIQREKILDKRRWKAEEDRKWGKVIDIERNSKRQIEIETERQRNRDRERDTQTDKHTQTDTQINRQTKGKRDGKIKRKKDRENVFRNKQF